MTQPTLILGAFVSPGLFFAGAAAVTIPIVIHLLARRRFRRIRWAAMDFLIDAERRNRRRIRMEDWILLALRCLAVLFIALIISRPFIIPSGLVVGWAGSHHIERIIVLDDSLSMACESRGGTSFDRARLAAKRLLQSIRADRPDDTVSILRMSAMDKPIESGAYLDDTQTGEVLARLEALTPSQRSVDAASMIDAVAEMLKQNAGIVNAAVYLISDFQRTGWIDRESTAKPDGENAGLLAPLAAWSEGDGRGMRLVFINVGDPDAANTAVTGLAIRAGQLVAGTTGALRAQVANFTDRSIENLRLDVAVENITQPSKTVRELPARQSASVDLEVAFLREGYEAARVELPPDALPTDNVRYVAAEVVNAIRVLIVNGEPSADDYSDEVTFLTTALRPEGEVFSGNELVIVDETELEDVNLTGFHVVILANVYRVSEPAAGQLETYARRGGGIIFFLGDQVDADLYNAVLYRGGEGLLPVELTERMRPADKAHLVVSDRLHPVMRGLSREGDPLGIGQIAFLEYFACTAPESTAGNASDDDAGFGDKDMSSRSALPARVIARFDDAGENPAIVERSVGRGRVVLVTTAADKEWHLWPDHPTYLPVIMELIHHVARRGDSGQEHRVGARIELAVDPAVFEPDVIVRTPAYPAAREVGVTALPAADGRGLTVTWEHTAASGFYQFVLKRRDGSETLRLVAVNVDPIESDLSMAQEAELRRAMGDTPFEYIQDLEELSGGAGEARTELWRVFLFAAAALLMGEQCLAFWWGRRR